MCNSKEFYKFDDDSYYYCWNGVCGFINADYVNSNDIDAYIDDEAFEATVLESLETIENEVAGWIKEQIAAVGL